MTTPRLRPSLAKVKLVVALVVAMGCAASAFTWFATSRPMSDHEHRDARAAAIRLLTLDAATGQMPSDLRERDRVFRSGRGDRRRLLATVWAPSALEQRVRDWEAGLAEVVRDPSYSAYSDNRYVVVDWHDVKKTALGRVLVVVRGHMEYQDAMTGQWGGSTDGTEYLTLTRVDGDWRLLREVVKDYNPS